METAKRLLIAASFGTTHMGTCVRTIGGVERALETELKGWDIARAFTSGMVRRALAGQGVEVDDLPAALAKAATKGYGTVAVLPTHLLYGVEYEKLSGQCAQNPFFKNVPVGKPLLAGTDDLLETVRILGDEYPARKGSCVVLMGHGTSHYVNPVYAALDYMFAMQGRPDVVVGAVEAYPALEQVLSRVAAGGYKRAVLAPLMLVAGDHAVKDMAGDEPGSWKQALLARGLQVEVALRGLGELEDVRNIYAAHGRELVKMLV